MRVFCLEDAAVVRAVFDARRRLSVTVTVSRAEDNCHLDSSRQTVALTLMGRVLRVNASLCSTIGELLASRNATMTVGRATLAVTRTWLHTRVHKLSAQIRQRFDYHHTSTTVRCST
jgi:hypothetical protein